MNVLARLARTAAGQQLGRLLRLFLATFGATLLATGGHFDKAALIGAAVAAAETVYRSVVPPQKPASKSAQPVPPAAPAA